MSVQICTAREARGCRGKLVTNDTSKKRTFKPVLKIMSKLRVGHAANSKLNGEWAKHVRKRLGWKKVTSGKRRSHDKMIIREELALLRDKVTDSN